MTMNYKNILVAVDGSTQSEKAFAEAVAIAKEKQAHLYVASIINDVELSYSAYAFSKVLNEEKEHLEKEMLKKIQYAQEQGVEEIKSIVEVGNPKAYLTKTIPETNEIDLIVMGATGKGAIQQVLVGSTTSYVVNHAPCNVLVIK